MERDGDEPMKVTTQKPLDPKEIGPGKSRQTDQKAKQSGEAAVKIKIQSGTYRVDADQLASKLIAESLREDIERDG